MLPLLLAISMSATPDLPSAYQQARAECLSLDLLRYKRSLWDRVIVRDMHDHRLCTRIIETGVATRANLRSRNFRVRLEYVKRFMRGTP